MRQSRSPPLRAHPQVVVAAPGVEARQDHKNIFDALKYAWEQAQWADKLATLHSTLTTVREQLQTANLVKQAIGDPVAAIALIDSGLFSDFLQDSGIADTLTDLAGIAAEGVQLSATIQELFEPIDISAWTDASCSFDGVASFRDPRDPLRRFRAVENAYSRFEVLLLQARSKRQTLKSQIAQLNMQLKNAKDDAEVQKLAGSLQAAETASSISMTWWTPRTSSWSRCKFSTKTASNRRKPRRTKSAENATRNSRGLPRRPRPNCRI